MQNLIVLVLFFAFLTVALSEASGKCARRASVLGLSLILVGVFL